MILSPIPIRGSRKVPPFPPLIHVTKKFSGFCMGLPTSGSASPVLDFFPLPKHLLSPFPTAPPPKGRHIHYTPSPFPFFVYPNVSFFIPDFFLIFSRQGSSPFPGLHPQLRQQPTRPLHSSCLPTTPSRFFPRTKPIASHPTSPPPPSSMFLYYIPTPSPSSNLFLL